MLKQFENLEKIIDDSNIEYNAQTGGFYCEDHVWKLEPVFSCFDEYKLVSNSEEEVRFISPELFLDVLKKTEESFYKIFSES